MTRYFTRGGVRTGSSGTTQNSINDASGLNIAFADTGVVTILGTCEGTIQPGVVTRIPVSKQQEWLKSGPLYEACKIVRTPTKEDRTVVEGARDVYVVRVNTAQRGTLDLENGSAADLINLYSKGYGLVASDIKVKVEAGSQGALGKKVTVTKPGYTDEVGDDLGFLPAFIVRHKGTSSVVRATLTITSSGLSTQVDTGSGLGADLSIDFASIKTLSQLVAEINRDSDYEAIAVANNPETFLCTDLDYVTAAEILYEDMDDVTFTDASITTGIGEVTSASGTTPNVQAGVVQLVGSEYMYLSTVTINAGTPPDDDLVAVRGYLDSTASAHAAVDNTYAFYPIGKTCKEVLDWVNSTSQLLTAEFDTSRDVGSPANITDTLLGKTDAALAWEGQSRTGAGQEWDLAVKALREHETNFILDLSGDLTVQQTYARRHMDWRWSNNKFGEWWGSIGSTSSRATKAQHKTRLKAVNHNRIGITAFNAWRPNDAGVSTELDAWSSAAQIVGILAGSVFGTDPVKKKLLVDDYSIDSSFDMWDDENEMVGAGGQILRKENGEWIFRRVLMSYTNGDNLKDIDPVYIHAMGWAQRDLNTYLDLVINGNPQQVNNAARIKSLGRTRREQQAGLNNSPLVGSSITPAHSNHAAVLNGQEWEYSDDVTFKTSNLSGNINTTVNVFQDNA